MLTFCLFFGILHLNGGGFMILRPDYINAITPFIDVPLVKILSGVRRSGKSTILEMMKLELQKRGMGVLARQKGKWYQPAMVFGEDTTVTATQTEEEKRAAAEKLKKEKEARAAEAARKAAAQKAAAEAAAKAAEKEKSDKMDAGIKELEERYRLQQMINQGKGKEAAIEEALNRARKQAEGLGTKLTADQEQRIRTVTAASYDLSHPAAAVPETPAAVQRFVSASIKTNSLTARGGFQSAVVMQDSEKYNRSIAASGKKQIQVLGEIKRSLAKLMEE